MKSKNIFISIIILLSTAIISCRKKNTILTDKNLKLEFSVDTLLFDTIFPTISSITRKFTVKNPYSNPIKISNATLAGGAQSPFRINIDGTSGTSFKDITIQADDSIYVFAEVTLDQQNQNNPFIIQDSIEFKINGDQQFFQLVAWGQDAYFHQNEILTGTLPNDKPHVIYGLAAVGYPGIDSNLTLNIEANTKLYLYNNSSLTVYKSTLNINGTKDNPVTFNATRNKGYYENISGQFTGIQLIASNNSNLNYVEIKNANIGIQIDTLYDENTPSLTISNTKIVNSFTANILVNAGAYVIAKNCVFGNAESYSAAFLNGGKYNFNNCTFANYNFSKKTPGVIIKNYFNSETSVFARPIIDSEFRNCVFDGINEDELDLDLNENSSINLSINYSSVKTSLDLNQSYFSNVFINILTNFVDPENFDYSLNSNSELIDKANPLTSETLDINRSTRGSFPDIGAYEYEE